MLIKFKIKELRLEEDCNNSELHPEDVIGIIKDNLAEAFRVDDELIEVLEVK